VCRRVGYGDITATNDIERMFAVVLMVVGGGVFGYIVVVMGNVVSNANRHARRVDKRVGACSQQATPCGGVQCLGFLLRAFPSAAK
jgi:hypothetical protein